ncbi:metallophosphoesterase [Chryseobacterium nepalense]|jgi:hypothetical protein|uniref:metallophosphoesterase n=1 Tax=Chryseobacterium nepalense TaxID=1854498 RepID=UPI002E0CB013|nr:hypothetical protein [Chryseobacterium nepalense]
MLNTTITSFNELNKWLSDNFYFEDGHILSIKENPLEIVVGYNTKANYKANSERHILSFKITSSNIIEWDFDKKSALLGEDNYIESIESIEVEHGICLEFFTPAIIRLTAENLVIEEQELIKTTFKPWVSDKEIFLTSDLYEIPKPEFWKQKLNKYGHHISFRYYAGDERLPNQVPYPDYQGYFIQLTDKIKHTQEGIFLKHLQIVNGKLNLSFENKDDELKNVWNDLTLILANFPNAKIHCGNCEFTGTQWKQYLSDKVLPTIE